MASTSLTVYHATGILSEMMDKTATLARCAVCATAFAHDEETWNICSGPQAPEGTPGIPEHHSGHTACTKCAMDPIAYIAEGGACRAVRPSSAGVAPA